MEHLDFLNALIKYKLAVNPARVLLYVEANPACQQRDMLEPLNIKSRTLLSQSCHVLINQGLIFQDGPYTSKTHNMTDKGRLLIQKIKHHGNN
jgi:predicted transcriptional regulator